MKNDDKNSNSQNSKESFENLTSQPKPSDKSNTELLNDDSLNTFIENISKDSIKNNNLSQYYKVLKKIYNGKFRHSYSSVTEKILFLDTDKNRLKSALGFILDNISLLIEKCKDDNIKNGLHKLKDHINLEHIRLGFLEKEYGDTLKTLTDNTKAAQDKLKQTNEDLKNSKINYVTILGIFSAIIIAFTGSVAFPNQVLKIVGTIELSAVFMIVSVIAIFIGTIIFALFWFIIHLNDRAKSFSLKEPFWIFALIFEFAFIVIFAISAYCLYCNNKNNTNPISDYNQTIDTNKTNMIEKK